MYTQMIDAKQASLAHPIDSPIYDITKSYAENVRQGPSFTGKIPPRTFLPESEWIDFLGYRIASPLGVPAGPLLNSQWTSLAAQLGFDIVVYKTIRSKAHPGHPLPNVIFVQPDHLTSAIAHPCSQPNTAKEISITNSFGMPSMDPTFLQEDIAKARNPLHKGQLLIVSVVGTPGFSESVAEDFVRTAQLAKESGAQVIEANFSCPNIASKEGSLYTDPKTAYKIAKQLVEAVSPLPVLIKVGHYPAISVLQDVLVALARAGVKGVCGINSVSMRVVDENNHPALGKERESSGICGNCIRTSALNFVAEVSRCIAKERLDLELAGCGGIVEPSHFDLFLQAGAKVALTATGMMWNPYIALKWHETNI